MPYTETLVEVAHTGDIVSFDSCTICGALVEWNSHQTHDDWHKRIGSIADDASWGAMAMRPIGGSSLTQNYRNDLDH